MEIVILETGGVVPDVVMHKEDLRRADVTSSPLSVNPESGVHSSAGTPPVARFVGTLGILILLVVAITGVARAQDRDITVWAVEAEHKVRPGDRIRTETLVWSRDENQVRVAGAGNEHVAFQVVITTPVPEGYRPAPPDGFFIEASDLVSSGGATIPSERVRLFLEHYILLHGKSSPIGDTGYWPDALAPIANPFSMGVQFGVVEHRPIWVDVDIPANTPAGTYTGKITVTQHGNVVGAVDVALQVYGFSLPDETPLITYINTSRGWLASYYRLPSDSKEIEDLTAVYYDFLYDYRMEPWFNNPLEPQITLEGRNVKVSFNDERYDYYLNELNTKRVLLEAHPREIARAFRGEYFSAAHRRAVTTYLSAVEDYFEKHGWKDRLVFNSPIDEPNTKEAYEDTRRWADLVHEATTDVPFLSTETPVSDDPDWGTLRGHVDNFSVHGNYLNRPEVKQAIREVQASGGEITWYISCDQAYPQPNYFIDAPALDLVMLPWITARYDMDGILYWATNFWTQTSNPWLDPVTFHSGFFCSDGYVLNGEGSLIYPGDSVERFTGQPNVEGPVSSIRFEMLRDGIEDYVYLSMLEDLGDAEFADQEVRNLVVDVSAFSRNAEELHLARRRMAARLEELVGSSR